MWRIWRVGESAIAMPQIEARMASSVVVDMQGSFWRRAGRGRPAVSPAGRRGRDSRRRAGGSRLRERASAELTGPAVAPTIRRVPRETGTKLIAENRRSRHDYELLERVEAGIVLTGTEVKALRAGHAQLGQAYADVRGGEMWLVGASISEYAQGNIANHVTDRDRKLLLKRSEIDASTPRCGRRA